MKIEANFMSRNIASRISPESILTIGKIRTAIMNVARMSLATALGGIIGSWMIAQWDSALLMQLCGFGLIALIFYFAFLVRRQCRQGKTDLYALSASATRKIDLSIYS